MFVAFVEMIICGSLERVTVSVVKAWKVTENSDTKNCLSKTVLVWVWRSDIKYNWNPLVDKKKQYGKKIIALFTVLKIVHTTFWWDDLYKKSWPKLSQNHTKKKPYKNILTYHIGYVTAKDLHYSTINNVNPLYLIMRKSGISFYWWKQRHTRKYEGVWNKIRNLIRLKTND